MLQFSGLEGRSEGNQGLKGSAAGKASPASAAAAAAATPPTLLGGVQSTQVKRSGVEVGVDWLTASFPAEHVEPLIAWLDRFTCVFSSERREWGRNGYDRSWYVQVLGIEVWFDSSPERCHQVHKGRATVNIPGQCFSKLTADKSFELLRMVKHGFEGRATRIDAMADDFDRCVLPHEVFKRVAVQRDVQVKGFRRIRPAGELDLATGRYVGDGVYFGSRGEAGSGKMLCLYDKGLQTEGVRNCIRWEVRFWAERAEAVFDRLSSCVNVEEFREQCGKVVCGVIDFVDQSEFPPGRDGVSRPSWWQSLVDRLGRAFIRVPDLKSSVDRVDRWIQKSVSASLAMVAKLKGAGYVDALLQLGEVRMSKRHEGLIASYRAAGSEGVQPAAPSVVDRVRDLWGDVLKPMPCF